jgi:chemotaxis protein methyltransferase CheR
VELTSQQFGRFRDLIYAKLGIHFEDRKVYFLKRRLEERMAAHAMAKFDEYVFLLAQCDPDGVEMQALANLITTNETYMFREYEQLEGFANLCLPEVVDAKRARGDRTLRIWSAGCSSGEEPYTLAIIVREVLLDVDRWRVEIVATDVDEGMLELSAQARYGERSIKHVPEDYRPRHLVRTGREEYAIRPETKALVTVRHLNLHDRAAMRQMRGFDFIFCRNVLIYFDDASRKGVVDHFYEALNPDGFIFLGHSESVGRITPAFKLRRLEKQLVYCKVAA